MNKKFALYFFILLMIHAACRHGRAKHNKFVCGYSYEWKGYDTPKDLNALPDSSYAFFITVALYDRNMKKLWEPSKKLWNPFVMTSVGNFKKTTCILQSMNVFDSIHILMPVNDFTSEWMHNFDFYSDSVIVLAIKLVGKLSPVEWRKYSDSIQNSEKLKLDSIQYLRKYFKDTTGILVQKKLSVKPSKVPRDATYEITYGCRSLNGVLLDSVFEPIYIQEGDLARSYFLKSINYVIEHISCNDTIKFILPSHLAFGEKGFYSIIPPNTPLEYTLIKRKK